MNRYKTILLIVLFLCGCGDSSTDGESSVSTNSSSDNNQIETTTTIETAATTATLSWVTPVMRENSSALGLSEISGYKIYYSTDENNVQMGEVIDVSGDINSYTVESLNSGETYYFGIATVDTDGREGSLSLLVSKNIE